MTRWQVESASRVREVTVGRDGAVHRLRLDGKTFVVDLAHVGVRRLSLLLRQEGDEHAGPGRVIDAALVPGREPGSFDVQVNGRRMALTLTRDGAAGSSSGAGDRGRDARHNRLLAPMPGKISRVLVSAGETVAARQGLVVVEAMKMENELRASRPGRVAEVRVVAGQLVDAGALLLTLE